MRTVAINFVVESVKDCNFIVSVVVDSIGKQQKPSTVPRAIIASRMPPRGRDEEVGVNSFMQQGVYGVASRPVLQQGRRQL
jgi:hypothetical protein